jgi:glycosyltransferase involved in cell wall biosynthesis
MSEAMCLGTPVIATAYSGNMDFMNDDNSILIPWTYVAVGDGAEPYSPTSQWAEPDVDAASKAMQKLSSNESLGRELGARGQQSLAEKFSVERCGVEARKRIEQIQETLG